MQWPLQIDAGASADPIPLFCQKFFRATVTMFLNQNLSVWFNSSALSGGDHSQNLTEMVILRDS